MARTLQALLSALILCAMLAASVQARGGGHGHGHRHGHHVFLHPMLPIFLGGGVAYDVDTECGYSTATSAEFLRRTGYADGRPGYAVTCYRPRGGFGWCDCPENLLWEPHSGDPPQDQTK